VHDGVGRRGEGDIGTGYNNDEEEGREYGEDGGRGGDRVLNDIDVNGSRRIRRSGRSGGSGGESGGASAAVRGGEFSEYEAGRWGRASVGGFGDAAREGAREEEAYLRRITPMKMQGGRLVGVLEGDEDEGAAGYAGYHSGYMFEGSGGEAKAKGEGDAEEDRLLWPGTPERGERSKRTCGESQPQPVCAAQPVRVLTCVLNITFLADLQMLTTRTGALRYRVILFLPL
jgi:hypothetical protein